MIDAEQQKDPERDDAIAAPAGDEGTPAPDTSPSTEATSRLGDFIEGARARLAHIRRGVLRATPAVIVNNASNFISMVHLVAETWMLKSGGVVFMANHRNDGPVHPIIDPMNNLKRAVTGEDRVDRFGGVQQNRFQVLSTSTGLANWTLGAVVPEGRDNEEQIDSMVQLSKQHPVKYYLKRAVEGLYWFNPKYKRQQIGLGVTMTGIFSFLSGFTNVAGGHHYRNLPHSLNGLLTTAAGLQLWFATDREQAWSHYGATMSARTLLLPFTIWEKHDHADINWGYYAAGATALQSSAILSYFIGGAEKRHDGSIVDHRSELLAARKKYAKQHDKKHDALPVPAATTAPDTPEQPSLKVSQVSHQQMAVSQLAAAERTAS